VVYDTKSHTFTANRDCFNPKAHTFPNSGKVQHVSTNSSVESAAAFVYISKEYGTRNPGLA